MAYKLRLGEPVVDDLRRIGCEQIDQALGLLTDPEDTHRSVHESRKCLKRVRALLRLARPALPPETFRSENRRFRDIARALSAARDSQAMLESLAKLEGQPRQASNGSVISDVRARLQSDRARHGQDLDGGTLVRVIESLRDARRGFAALAPTDGAERIFQGLETSYRGGRKAQVRARVKGADEDYHEWRKWVQQHWRHMQLLAECWPAAFQVRIDSARALSQTLGDDHDLSVLIDKVEKQKDEGADPGDMDALIADCQDRQRALRRQADLIGARLYAERPAAFRARMEAYWRAAPEEAATDAGAAVAEPAPG